MSNAGVTEDATDLAILGYDLRRRTALSSRGEFLPPWEALSMSQREDEITAAQAIGWAAVGAYKKGRKS